MDIQKYSKEQSQSYSYPITEHFDYSSITSSLEVLLSIDSFSKALQSSDPHSIKLSFKVKKLAQSFKTSPDPFASFFSYLPPALKQDLTPFQVLSTFVEDFSSEVPDYSFVLAFVSVSKLLSHTGRPQEVFEKEISSKKAKVAVFELVWDVEVTMENVTKVVKCIPGNLQAQGFMEVAGIVNCTGCYYMSVCKVNDQWKFFDKFIDKEPVSWVKIAWFLVSGNRYPALLAYHRVDGYKSTANFITSLDYENLLKFSKKQDSLIKQKSRNTERSKDDSKSLEKPPLKPSLGKTSSESRDNRSEVFESEDQSRKSTTPLHKKYDFSEMKADFRQNRPKDETRPSLKKSEQVSPRNKDDSFRSWERGEEMERIYLGTPKESQPVRSFSRQEESLAKLNYTPQRPDRFSHFSPKDQEKQNPSPYFRERNFNVPKDEGKNEFKRESYVNNEFKRESFNNEFKREGFLSNEFKREGFSNNEFRNREDDDRGEGINRDDLQMFEKNRGFDSAQKERYRPSFENFNREDLAPRRDPDESLSKNSKHFESLLEKYKEPKKDLEKDETENWKIDQFRKDDQGRWKDSIENERRRILDRNEDKTFDAFKGRGVNEESEGNDWKARNRFKEENETWKVDVGRKDDVGKWRESLENERKRLLERNDEKITNEGRKVEPFRSEEPGKWKESLENERNRFVEKNEENFSNESWKTEGFRNEEIKKWRESMENERKKFLDKSDEKGLENFRFRAKNDEFDGLRDIKPERSEESDSFHRRPPQQDTFDPSRYRLREERSEINTLKSEEKPSDSSKDDPSRFKLRSEDYFEPKSKSDLLEKFRREEKLEDFENMRFRLDSQENSSKPKFDAQENSRVRNEDLRLRQKEEKQEVLFRPEEKNSDLKKEESPWLKYRTDNYFDQKARGEFDKFRREENNEEFENLRFRIEAQESASKMREDQRTRVEENFRSELRAQDLNPSNESDSREKSSIRQVKSFDSAEVAQKYKFLEAEDFSKADDSKSRAYRIESPAEGKLGRDPESFSRKEEAFKPRDSEKRADDSSLSEWNCAKCSKKVSGASYECAECRLINWDQFYKVKSLQHNRGRAEETRNGDKDLKESEGRDEAVRRLYSFSDKKEEDDWVCSGCATSNKSLFFLCKGCRKPKTMAGGLKEARFSS